MTGLVRERVFADIYRRNTWNGRAGTRAGPGSSLGATELLREAIPRIVAELHAATVLDAACGDSLWMPDLPGYVGVDIVRAAVAVAARRHPDRAYMVADICKAVLPECDLIICRDAMQHMSFADGLATLANFRRTGAGCLLASTHRETRNEDVPTGGYYQINLEAPPFDLGEPMRTIPDGAWDAGIQYPHKLLGLWRL